MLGFNRSGCVGSAVLDPGPRRPLAPALTALAPFPPAADVRTCGCTLRLWFAAGAAVHRLRRHDRDRAPRCGRIDRVSITDARWQSPCDLSTAAKVPPESIARIRYRARMSLHRAAQSVRP